MVFSTLSHGISQYKMAAAQDLNLFSVHYRECLFYYNQKKYDHTQMYVFPIQYVLKHCGAHKHNIYIYIYNYMHARDPKKS